MTFKPEWTFFMLGVVTNFFKLVSKRISKKLVFNLMLTIGGLRTHFFSLKKKQLESFVPCLVDWIEQKVERER